MRRCWPLLLVLFVSGCPDSRRPPPPPQAEEETAEEPAAPPTITVTTLEALQTAYEAKRDAFRESPSPETWQAAVASLDELREAAEGALEILEDYEPVERDELVRARPKEEGKK